MNLGLTLKNIRKQKGIKQITLAEKCAITQAFLSNIEANRKDPTLSTLNKLSKVLEVPLPIIFFLSMDEEDVNENKKAMFSTIAPLMKQTLSEAFI